MNLNFEGKIKSVLASKGAYGWSLIRFADELTKKSGRAWSQSAVTMMMKAKNPTTKRVRFIADVLGVSPSYFFTGRIRTRKRKSGEKS